MVPRLALVSLTLLVSRVALAQPAQPAPIPSPSPSPSPSADSEDLSDIENALAEDAAAAEKSRPAPPPGGLGAAVQSMNPDISFIADFAAAWFSEDENLQTGEHDPHENGFNFQQLELALGKAVDPYFRLDGNIVFHPEGVEIEELYATTLSLPYNLQARVGQFLTRFGRQNPTHPHQWDFVDQPLMLGKVFGGEGNFALGGELSYLTPLPWYVELIGSVTDARGEGTNRSFFGDAADARVDSPLDFQDTVAAKQFFELSHDWSLLWGLSWATGPNPDGRTHLFGTDVYLKYRPITTGSYTIVALQAEAIYRRRGLADGHLDDVTGYAQLFWRFAQRWAAAARYEYGSPAENQDGVRVDPLDPDWTRNRHRAAADLTFWPSEFSRLRAQLSVDAPRWLPDPIVAGFLALEVSIGVHGAHKF